MIINSKWIYYETGTPKGADDKYGNPSPYFRKTFHAKKYISRATLYIAALGVFKAYVNGSEVSDEYLSPPWVDYTKKIPLMLYDITDKLQSENAVGIILGDGWAVGHVGSNATFKRNTYSDTIKFTAEILIEYCDGDTEKISTDKTWLASCGEIIRSDIYMGEFIDKRKSLGNYFEYEYNDSSWGSAKEDDFKFSKGLYLDKIDIEPIRVKHVFNPIKIKEYENRIIYDVGQNIAGVMRAVIKGDKGSKVIFRHAEILNNERLYTENLRKAEATDTVILKGCGEEEFRPLFTYHGFRFVEAEIVGNARILDLKAEAMYTDLESDGDFSCSSDLVNKLYMNILWSQRDNFYSVPTDCPQRDERLGWTGDAQVFCQSAMYNMNCKKYYAKYLSDIRDSQLGNGAVPCIAPTVHVGYNSYSGYDAAAGWSEAIAVIPYLHYKMYGDKSIIKDNIHAAKELLRYYKNDSSGYIRSGRDGRYGDWLNVNDDTDLDVIATLYYAHASDLVSKMCTVINDDDAAYYNELYVKIKSAFLSKFIIDNKILSDSQTAYVLAYKFKMVSAEFTKENLSRKLKESNGHLSTGFLGVRYLLPTLCDIGLAENAYVILTNESYPGWGYSIKKGATTIWEHWDSNDIEKLSAMNSFNHYSLGSCMEWLYEYCLGIRPDELSGGFKKMKLKPYMDKTGRINSASGSYRSVLGTIKVNWKREGDVFRYEASVPESIDARYEFDGFELIKTEKNKDTVVFILKEKH